MDSPTHVFKILLPEQFPIDPTKEFPTPLDESSGFVHLSTAAQALRVANLFYSSSNKLILCLIPVANFKKGDLVWESPSHPTPSDEADKEIPNTELFPHLYGKLTSEMISSTVEIVKEEDGFHFAFEQ
ncbi:hypothetical protein HK100_006848 [Physocladia obscura]|uniref:DUF952 domain-containing protein n=1 Tax=Physocladia obscura TaxID=109957 RepID=A0AAD5XB48_9FUNG|nr:hypothetical protein HK100_006848 [Physocladia obscura]